MNASAPIISVIIVSYNVQDFLDLCLDAVIRSLKNIPSEIFVVDNNSSDDTVALVKQKYPQIKLIANKENLGFSKANNQALALSKGKYVHFLNPDTIVSDDYYTKTLAFITTHNDIGAVGPRLIDADGKYAFDSKKSFPSFWVSVAKVLGLSKAFPNSKFFNKYYAAHVGKDETAPVDILSGCCMLVHKEHLIQSGGGFDEMYFMYCEDVDMCHRLNLHGYKNYYYPQVTVLHYKGESTRKLTFSYMKIFHEAHALFVKKYYPKQLGAIFTLALKSVLIIRNIFNILKYIFVILKIFILDAIIISGTLLIFRNYWFDQVLNQQIDSDSFMYTIPIFLVIWMLTLFFSGAYDKPYSLFRAGRGMLLGTIFALAIYGLFPLEWRYSRAVVLFSGILSTVVLLLSRSFFAYLNIIDLVPRGKNDYKAIIIADEEEYKRVKTLLYTQNYQHHIEGWVSNQQQNSIKYLGNISEIATIQKTLAINEIIICTSNINYTEVLNIIQTCGDNCSYKIIPPHSSYIISSKNTQNLMELYGLSNISIGSPMNRRNKRIIDILLSLITFLIQPIIYIKGGKNRIKDAFDVLMNKKTWIGYSNNESNKKLPNIKVGIFPPYEEILSPKLPETIKSKANLKYAKEYHILDDIKFYLQNIFFKKN
jgi:GT2 family glycosyltransferase